MMISTGNQDNQKFLTGEKHQKFLTGEKHQKFSTGNDNYQKFLTGEDNNQDNYNIFYKDDSAFIIPENKNKTIKIVYPNLYDFGLARYYNDETGENKYYYTLELGKIVSFIKKEFTPYDENKTVIEIELKVYNKELNTTNNYYINSVDEHRLEEMIQSLKDYGFVMSEGTVEECYYNYLGTNLFGKFVWELYKRK